MPLPRSLNAFIPVTSVNFKVFNNTKGKLGSQSILVFLTPVMNSEDYLYAAWQKMEPGEGGATEFTLNQEVSAQALSEKNFSNSMVISPGSLSSCINPSSLAPELGVPEPSSAVTPRQAGVVNKTSPFKEVDIAWKVNKNLVVQSKLGLASGAYSTFELQTRLYWTVAMGTTGPNYTLQQITPYTTYDLPAGVGEVNVNVTYSNETGKFNYAFDPAS